MGYDVTRFQGDVDEDLICPICSGVLEEPVQVSCFYFYCEYCPILETSKDIEIEQVWRRVTKNGERSGG